MRVVVVAGAGESLTPAALVAKLAKDGTPPLAVLRLRSSGAARLRGRVAAAVRPWVRRADDEASAEGRRLFAEYATRHGLAGIERPLAEVCASRGVEVVPCGGVNDAETIRAVKGREVDLVLNTVPAIFREMLAAPRVGVLNAHTAPLPEIRGMNAIEWSLLLRRAPEVSVHFMDAGIDTGDLLVSEPLPLAGATSISRLRGRVGPIQVDLLARAAAGLADGSLARRPQRLEDGRQHFAMHPRLKALAERRLVLLASSPDVR